MQQPAVTPRQARSFSLLFFAYWGYIGVSSTYTSLYFADRGISPAQIGILMSVVQFSRICGPNVWAWIADRASRRVTVLRIASAAALLSYFGLAFGSGFVQFFIAMVAINLCTSAQRPLANALVMAELRGDITHYGRFRLWGPVGFIAMAGAGGYLFDALGIGAMPWAAALMLAVLAAASLATSEPPAHRADGPPPSIAALVKRREVIAFLASSFLMLAAHAALYAFYSLYLDRLGYSKAFIGLMWSLGAAVEIVFYVCQPSILRRWSAAQLMLACQLLAVLRFLMIGLGAGSLLVLLAAQVLHAATMAGYQTASLAVMQRWFAGPLQARGQALVISTSYGLGGAVGAVVLGRIWSGFGPLAVFVMAAAWALAGTGAAWLSFRWQASDRH